MAGIKRRLLQADDSRSAAMTLSDLMATGHDVFCWCNRCSHNAVLPTTFLLERLGPNAPVPEIGMHLLCSHCGKRDIATRPAWPTQGPITRHHS